MVVQGVQISDQQAQEFRCADHLNQLHPPEALRLPIQVFDFRGLQVAVSASIMYLVTGHQLFFYL